MAPVRSSPRLLLASVSVLRRAGVTRTAAQRNVRALQLVYRAAGGSISCSSELGIIFDAMVRLASRVQRRAMHSRHARQGAHLAAVDESY
jgi:hypothetical protein